MLLRNMNGRVLARVPHISDPWITGAVGLGIWSMLALCIGGRIPHSHTKNLWLLMPKVNVITFLEGALEANHSLSPPANTYYEELIKNFIPALQEVYSLLPQESTLTRSLNNSVVL